MSLFLYQGRLSQMLAVCTEPVYYYASILVEFSCTVCLCEILWTRSSQMSWKSIDWSSVGVLSLVLTPPVYFVWPLLPGGILSIYSGCFGYGWSNFVEKCITGYYAVNMCVSKSIFGSTKRCCALKCNTNPYLNLRYP